MLDRFIAKPPRDGDVAKVLKTLVPQIASVQLNQNEMLTRLVRMETRLCALLEASGVDPRSKKGTV